MNVEDIAAHAGEHELVVVLELRLWEVRESFLFSFAYQGCMWCDGSEAVIFMQWANYLLKRGNVGFPTNWHNLIIDWNGLSNFYTYIMKYYCLSSHDFIPLIRISLHHL